MAAGPISTRCTHLASTPLRKAALALRACRVTIKRPQTNLAAEAKKLPLKVVLSFVEVREIDPPTNATPAHWRLLTTRAVTTPAAANQITGFHCQRRAIDQLFRGDEDEGVQCQGCAYRRQYAVREAGIA